MTEAAQASDGGFALYIHWPFCLKKCPYCDFNSHVRETIDQTVWRHGLLQDMDAAALLSGRRRLGSIFFGGGTPSLMPPATVAALIDRAAHHWDFAPDIEITLEANPTSVEAGRLAGFKTAGINRVSIGIQSLDDRSLAFLGRAHSAREAKAALALARSLFDRFSFDLIYARPNQSVAAWQAELTEALDVAGDHLSLYQLTLEPGTQFHHLAERGALTLPDDGLAGDLYECTAAMMAAAGMPAYEISNHAKPGGESRHNLTYWRYGDYVGIGPGAHGRLTLGTGSERRKIATRQKKAPESWLHALHETGSGLEPVEIVSPEDQLSECLMMGLRLAEGIALARLDAMRLEPDRPLFDGQHLADLIEGGFILQDATHLKATAAGRQRLNAVLAHLIA